MRHISDSNICFDSGQQIAGVNANVKEGVAFTLAAIVVGSLLAGIIARLEFDVVGMRRSVKALLKLGA